MPHDEIRERTFSLARHYGLLGGVRYAEPFVQKEVGLVDDLTPGSARRGTAECYKSARSGTSSVPSQRRWVLQVVAAICFQRACGIVHCSLDL